MKLDLLKQVLAGSHVLVRLHSEGDTDGEVYAVPKADFERWKSAIVAAGDDWPDELNDLLDEGLTEERRLPVERWISTVGDGWGCGDEDGEFGRFAGA